MCPRRSKIGSKRKLSDDENQALAAQFRKGKEKKENHPPKKKFQKFDKGKRDILNSNVTVVKSWDILPEIVPS